MKITRERLILRRISSALPEYERDERDRHDEEIEQVEAGAAERARMEDEAVRDHLQADFHGEDRREEVVEVI